MSTPEQQVDFLLTPEFVRGEGQEGVEQASLEELEQFHSMLCEHSGVSALEEGNGQGGDEEGLQARLRQLYDILLKQRRDRKDHTEALRSEEAKGVCASLSLSLCVCVCVCACVRACVCACMRACVQTQWCTE